MKPGKIVLTVLLIVLYLSSNAQVFVGGSIGLNTTGGSTENGTVSVDKPSTIVLNLSPKAGKFLSDNWAAGIALNLMLSRTTSAGTPQSVTTSTGIGAAPFIRYYAVKMDKFSLFGQGNIGFSYSSAKTKVGGVTTDGPQITNVFLNIFPAVAYDLSDRLSLETNINILNFGYSLTINKNGTTKDKTSTFGIGAGLNSIVTVGAISIGGIYKFGTTR